MESYKISWQDDFTTNTADTFKKLFADTIFTDVTLACDDGQTIEAHKVILSACSDFFRKILIKKTHPHPLIFLRGISYEHLKNILRFSYLGETEMDQESLKDFVNIAKDLEIVGLATLEEKKPELLIEDQSFSQPQNIKSMPAVLTQNERKLKRVKSSVNSSVNLVAADDSFSLVLEDDVPGVNMDYSFPSEVKEESKTSVIKSESVFPCTDCSYKATYANHLRRHTLSVHEGVRYSCESCDKKFTQKPNLNKHVARKHSK